MRIAPIDIVNRKFGRALRGLHPAEVADFQTEIAGRMEALLGENAQLRETIENLRVQVAKYTRIEETFAPEALEKISTWIVERTR